MLDEGRLQWMQIRALGEPLDRGDGLAVVHDRERQAGVDAASFDQHRARAALAVIATLFRAGQGEVLPQSIEQCRAGIEGQRMRMAVNLKCDAHRWRGRLSVVDGSGGNSGAWKRRQQQRGGSGLDDGTAGNLKSN
jgi:hypothetical protein